MLPNTMFWGLSVWYWTTNQCALPQGGPLLLFPAFLSCLQFSVSLMGFSPSSLVCSLLSSLFSSRLGSCLGETSWVYLLLLLGSKLPNPWALKIFLLPFLQCSLRLKGGSVCRSPGTGLHNLFKASSLCKTCLIVLVFLSM